MSIVEVERDRFVDNVTMNRYNFENEKKLKYLGAIITTDNDIGSEIKV